MTVLEDWIKEHPTEWAHSAEDPAGFAQILGALGIIEWGSVPDYAEQFVADYAEMQKAAKPAVVSPLVVSGEYRTPEEVEKMQTELAKEATQQILQAKVQSWFVPAMREMIKSIWEWIKSTFGDFFKAVWETTKRLLTDAWQWIRAQFEALGRTVYDGMVKLLAGASPMTPEMAPLLALKLYGFGLTQGMSAHAIAVIAENVHPLKTLGMSQIAAMIGDLSAFGRIAAATLGVYTSVALAGPMRYAVQKETRPVLPDDGLLQTLAVKQDVTLEQFREYMKYQGYSDYWIGRIEATMYREPMYRELLIMAESDVATDAWMIDKLRRSGYDRDDAPVMHRALLKRIALAQRNSYYSEAFKLYKEGYITKEYFTRVLDELGFRPEAKHFAVRSAELAYLYDATGDQVKYWTDSYLKDLISHDELRLHMSLLGVVPERVWLLTQIARVRKYKKPAVAVKMELEPVTSQVQSKYSQAYIALYRKGLIDEAILEADLIAIGIKPELAEATVFLEAARGAK